MTWPLSLSFTFLCKSCVGWSQAAGVKPWELRRRRAVIFPQFMHTLTNSQQHSSVNLALSNALIAKLKVWSFITFKIYYTVLHIRWYTLCSILQHRVLLSSHPAPCFILTLFFPRTLLDCLLFLASLSGWWGRNQEVNCYVWWLGMGTILYPHRAAKV